MGSRKMRRPRANSVTEMSGFDLYAAGDAKGAIEAFQNSDNLRLQYNSRLLRADSISQSLEEQIATHTKNPNKKKRNKLIMAFNRALQLFAQSQIQACQQLCLEHLPEQPNTLHDELVFPMTRMALLFIECSLVSAAEPHPKTPAVLSFVENVKSPDNHLKFLVPLFKARLGLELENSKYSDNSIRLSRKEIKTAMEIFQNKLRTANEATSSVVSSQSEETPQNQQPPPPSNPVLQKLNQTALTLKAHLEQLKGNTKKSIVLCSEALAATTNQNPEYQALLHNNLSIVYATNNRRNLALYNVAKALRYTSTDRFHDDGTAKLDHSLQFLYNAGICALRARNFVSAYQCLANCVRDELFRERRSCWLRLAEACIGVFADLQRESHCQGKLATIRVDDKPEAVLIHSNLFASNIAVPEELVSELGSSQDLEQVRRNPLLRARHSLQFVLQSPDELSPDMTNSARLSLAYTQLAFGEYADALQLAKVVLDVDANSSDSETVGRLRRRQLATARMYAAEASTKLGEKLEAMKFLVGDGKDDAFDRLASHLSGVSFESTVDESSKRRLAKAQVMVRSSACTVTAEMGNPAAKQLANSANAMEDAYCASSKRSSARRALIYTLLCDRNESSALSMLSSLQ